MERGAAMAVTDLNAAAGVLGEQVQLITVDDYCDPDQAVWRGGSYAPLEQTTGAQQAWGMC